MISSKEGLIITVKEANSLLADTSVFALLGINNPVDKIFDKIPGKGYYLTALVALAALGLYSKIYFNLKSTTPKELTVGQKTILNDIQKLIKANDLESYFIQKAPGSTLSSDEDFFEKFMLYLKKDKKIDLGLKDSEFRVAWKQIRNMLIHILFPWADIGGKHIPSTDKKAISSLKLPKYKIEEIMRILRNGFNSSEAFKMKEGKLTLNSTVLLAYLFPIRDILIEEINNADEAKCNIALKSLKDLVNRQKVMLQK